MYKNIKIILPAILAISAMLFSSVIILLNNVPYNPAGDITKVKIWKPIQLPKIPVFSGGMSMYQNQIIACFPGTNKNINGSRVFISKNQGATWNSIATLDNEGATMVKYYDKDPLLPEPIFVASLVQPIINGSNQIHFRDAIKIDWAYSAWNHFWWYTSSPNSVYDFSRASDVDFVVSTDNQLAAYIDKTGLPPILIKQVDGPGYGIYRENIGGSSVIYIGQNDNHFIRSGLELIGHKQITVKFSGELDKKHTIYSITRDSKNLWILLTDYGLYTMHSINNTEETAVPIMATLPINTICTGIVEDDKGVFWLNTYNSDQKCATLYKSIFRQNHPIPIGPSPNSKLSTVMIVTIIIGSVVALIIISALFYWKRRNIASVLPKSLLKSPFKSKSVNAWIKK